MVFRFCIQPLATPLQLPSNDFESSSQPAYDNRNDWCPLSFVFFPCYKLSG
ncbi:Protein of unknown function [Pyronema omphalodes CBS 100304]|uniref:Uncharacterized protein n=1 Tax=Pyronema omphalodes (strain CBS 100304) TaxID=1076935 RepID=U4L9J1_PYROM|nr:Protein of unknown function [Pyronema omphalodes CBS 100304]